MNVYLRILINLVHFLVVVPLSLVYLTFLVGRWAYREIGFRLALRRLDRNFKRMGITRL